MAAFGASRIQSKFKNVFADHPASDHVFSNLRVGTATGEQNYIQANPKFFCYASQGGGGPFVVVDLTKPGRVEADHPTVNGHTGACLNFDWNPHNDNVLATSSEDCTVKIWNVPDGGFTANHNEPNASLHGHMRKVTHVKWNPTAANTLASVGAEYNVKLWDIEKKAEVWSSDSAHNDLILDLAWDYTGNQYATTCKDKNVRLFDGRSGELTNMIEGAHSGSKSAKCCFLGPSGNMLTVGFTRTSMRQFKIWDPRDLTKPLKEVDIDQAAGVIMPFYDNDTGMLFLAGKGDGAIHYFDVQSTAPYAVPLNTYRSTASARGMAFLPKRGVDVSKLEACRLLKLTTNSVEPLSFIVPRKSDSFQPDLYPDTAACEASHTHEQWMGGSNKGPRVISRDPSSDGKSHDAAPFAAGGGAPVAFKAPVTVASLQKELDKANKRIAELEATIKDMAK